MHEDSGAMSGEFARAVRCTFGRVALFESSLVVLLVVDLPQMPGLVRAANACIGFVENV